MWKNDYPFFHFQNENYFLLKFSLLIALKKIRIFVHNNALKLYSLCFEITPNIINFIYYLVLSNSIA